MSFDELYASLPTCNNSPKLPMEIWVGREQCSGTGQALKVGIMGLGHRAMTTQDQGLGQAATRSLHTLPRGEGVGCMYGDVCSCGGTRQMSVQVGAGYLRVRSWKAAGDEGRRG